jgi:hypothetical protein
LEDRWSEYLHDWRECNPTGDVTVGPAWVIKMLVLLYSPLMSDADFWSCEQYSGILNCQ